MQLILIPFSNFCLLQKGEFTILMATLAEQASKLLDFEQKLDITLLDSIVGCMYSGAGEQVMALWRHESLS